MDNRKPLKVFLSVYSALFIREILQRTMQDRLSWIWILIQPAAQILIFVGLREAVGKMALFMGVSYIPWLIVGMMVFMLFSEGVVRSLGAIEASKGLFTYRQIKPIDTVVIRIIVEGIIKLFVFILIIFGASFFGLNLLPDKLPQVFALWTTLIFSSVGFALILSCVANLISGATTIIRIAMLPMYFVSGVMFPVSVLPADIQSILLINPILHLVELTRFYWFQDYLLIEGVSAQYILNSTLGFLFLGLILHIRYEERMKAA